jgi:hypothetical protein
LLASFINISAILSGKINNKNETIFRNLLTSQNLILINGLKSNFIVVQSCSVT